MQVGRVWRSLWSLYSDQQHQLQLRLHTSMEVEMPKFTWNLKQLLFNGIYDSSSNLFSRNLCPLPLSGDYLDPTNLVITCPLIPFMRIFLRFHSCLIFFEVLSLYCIFQERANIAGEWKLWTLHFCCMNKHSSTPSRHSFPKFTEMNPC